MQATRSLAGGLAIVMAWAGAAGTGRGDEPPRSAARIYTAAETPPPLNDRAAKPERLFPGPHMNSASLFESVLQLTLDTDERVFRTISGKSPNSVRRTTSSDGADRYLPRVTLTAKNAPLPPTLLVIEYFSKDPAGKAAGRRECVEHVPLPALDQGGTLTVDAKGIAFFKHEFKANDVHGRQFERSGGLDFYGIIVSVFKDDKVWLQMGTPQALCKECTDTLPSPQPPRGRLVRPAF